MAPVVKNPPANAGDMRCSFAPGEGNGNPLQYSCLDITLFGTNYLTNGNIMYFFWSKGTIKKNHWGTEGSMNLWSSQWCFAVPKDLICTWSWFGCWGCFSSVNFPPSGAQGTQGLSDIASSPWQCLSLTRAPLLSVLHAQLTLPSSQFQALSHDGYFVLTLILIYSQVPS